MNSMPFRQLKSFLKILIGVQYETARIEKKIRCPAADDLFRGSLAKHVKQRFRLFREGIDTEIFQLGAVQSV